MIRNLPANAGDVRDASLIPGLRRCPGGGQATHSNILAWRTPWTEEPGRLQSLGSQKSQMQLTKQQQILLFQSVVDKSPLDSDQSKSFISRTGLGAIATPQKGP